MAKDKKKNKKHHHSDNKTTQNIVVQTQVPIPSQLEDKPQLQTSQTLSNLPKVQEASTQNIVQPREVPTEVRVESQKNDQLPIESKIEAGTKEAIHQQHLSHQNQPQIEIQNAEVQTTAVQFVAAKDQPAEILIANDLRQQHINQPLEVIQEKSAEQIPSNTNSLQASNLNAENSNPSQLIAQNKLEIQVSEDLNFAKQEVTERQVVDSLPIESQHIQQSQVENQALDGAAHETHEKSPEVVALKEADKQAVPNLNSFISIDGWQEKEKPQIHQQEISNNRTVQINVEKEKQQNIVAENNIQKVQFSPNNDKELIEQNVARQIQPQSQKTVQKQSQQSQNNTQQARRVIDAEKITERTEQRAQPSTVSQTEPATSENITQVPTNSAHEEPESVHAQPISAYNIEVLHQSTHDSVEIVRQKIQNQQVTETICITESIEIEKIVYLQQRKLERSYQDEKVEVKPQVVEVHQTSNNVLDINQAIQIVPSVPQNQIPNNQNNQPPAAQEQREVDDRIFTLVQSSEIPAEEIEKDLRVDNSAEIPAVQISVKQSLSFSDLNYSVQKSTGQIEPQLVQEKIQHNLPEPEIKQPKAQVVVEEIKNEVVENEIKQNQHVQSPQQHVTLPQQPAACIRVEVLVEQKVEVAQPVIEVVRAPSPSQVVSVLIENQSEVAQRVQNSAQSLKQAESNLSQGQQLSTSNKEAIVEQARLLQDVKSIDPKEAEAHLGIESKLQREKQKKEDDGPSFVSKLMISSASFVLAGGINWAITESMQRSLTIGAVAAGGAFAALNLLKH